MHNLHDLSLKYNTTYYMGILVCFILLSILIIISIFAGTQTIPIHETLQAIIHFNPENSQHLLVRHLRIPRTFLAIVVGCALGLSGAIMQAITRNPLADPGIFGVNAGATLAIVCGIAFLGIHQIINHMLLGFIGAAIAGFSIYLLGGVRKGLNPIKMVLAGSALSVVLLAITQIITTNSDEMVFHHFRHWIVGSLQGRSAQILFPVTCLVSLGIAIAVTLLPSALNALALGHDLGTSLGINPLKIWILASITIIILAGTATAAAGPIGFIGLTAPHFARFIVGPDNRWVFPYAMLISAILVLVADCLGRVIISTDEISVGIMLALLGGPFFIVLVKKWKIVQL